MGENLVSRDHWRKVWNRIQQNDLDIQYFYGYDKTTKEPMYNKGFEKQVQKNFNAVLSELNENNGSGIDKAIAFFKGKRELVLQTEKSLYDNIIIPKKGKRSYTEMKEAEKIAAWTKIFYISDFYSLKKMNGQDCLRTLISSNEFIKLFRDTGTQASFIKMTNYYATLPKEKKDEGDLIKGQLTPQGRKKANEEFAEALANQRSGLVRLIKKTIIDQIKEDIQGAVEKKARKGIQEAIDRALEQTKKYQEDGRYDSLKEKLKRNLEEYLKEYYGANKKTLKNPIQIGKEDSGIFISISLTPPKKGIFSLEEDKLRKNNGNLRDDQKLQAFKNAVRETWEKIKPNNPLILSLDYGGRHQLSGKILEDFRTLVNKYIYGTAFDRTCKRVYDSNPKFFGQDWNISVVTGMLGELSVFLSSAPHVIEDLALVGNKADRFVDKSANIDVGLGEGFRDLTFTYNSVTYGINVKRYVEKAGKSFTLYADNSNSESDGVGISSQYMHRYFTQDEINLIRFIETNYLFIRNHIDQTLSSASVDEAYKTVSATKLDHFVRLSSAALGDAINLFYSINNVIIPASIIYRYIIDTLNDYNNATNLFTIKRYNFVKEAEYPSDEVQEKEKDLPEAISTNKNILNKTAKIMFNGLKLTDLDKIFFRK